MSNIEITEQLLNIITTTKNNEQFLDKLDYFFKTK